MKVGVIDYGAGNIFSILAGLRRANIDAEVITKPRELSSTDAVVIPGVGNFSQAAKSLKIFREQLQGLSEEGRYILGICLGMQILLDESEEGRGRGLGILEGCVSHLPVTVKVPHMGWNTIEVKQQFQLFEGLPESPYFYFVHSYYSKPTADSDVIATTTYGNEFASVIGRGSVIGLQFHPEKSGEHGARILDNFKELIVR
ncbi:MAG: imidazole glycerol phosphate synthase subunit HisH [Candidatus Thorarchaeota archaeon]